MQFVAGQWGRRIFVIIFCLHEEETSQYTVNSAAPNHSILDLGPTKKWSRRWYSGFSMIVVSPVDVTRRVREAQVKERLSNWHIWEEEKEGHLELRQEIRGKPTEIACEILQPVTDHVPNCQQ